MARKTKMQNLVEEEIIKPQVSEDTRQKLVEESIPFERPVFFQASNNQSLAMLSDGSTYQIFFDLHKAPPRLRFNRVEVYGLPGL